MSENRAFTESEALSASPPLIDIIAPDLAALLQQVEAVAGKEPIGDREAALR